MHQADPGPTALGLTGDLPASVVPTLREQVAGMAKRRRSTSKPTLRPYQRPVLGQYPRHDKPELRAAKLEACLGLPSDQQSPSLQE